MNSFMTWFDALSKREKVILISTATVAIIYAWLTYFYGPLQAEQKKLSTTLTTLKTDIAEQNLLALQIEVAGKVDPNAKNKKMLVDLKTELSNLKDQLKVDAKQFVSSQTMSAVLQQLLQKDNGLSLLELNTLPVTGLFDTPDKKSWIFKHTLNITIEGRYFDTLDYLTSLESLDWFISWDSIDFNVSEYPLATTTFQLYTLSFEEQWLGL